VVNKRKLDGVRVPLYNWWQSVHQGEGVQIVGVKRLGLIIFGYRILENELLITEIFEKYDPWKCF